MAHTKQTAGASTGGAAPSRTLPLAQAANAALAGVGAEHAALAGADVAATNRARLGGAAATLKAALLRSATPSPEAGYKPGGEGAQDGELQSLYWAAEKGNPERCVQVLAGSIALNPNDEDEQYIVSVLLVLLPPAKAAAAAGGARGACAPLTSPCAAM